MSIIEATTTPKPIGFIELWSTPLSSVSAIFWGTTDIMVLTIEGIIIIRYSNGASNVTARCQRWFQSGFVTYRSQTGSLSTERVPPVEEESHVPNGRAVPRPLLETLDPPEVLPPLEGDEGFEKENDTGAMDDPNQMRVRQ